METTSLQSEAHEMALQLLNNNSSEVREFIAGHDTPAKLVLAMVRNLWTLSQHDGADRYPNDTHLALVDAVLRMQALLEFMEV